MGFLRRQLKNRDYEVLYVRVYQCDQCFMVFQFIVLNSINGRLFFRKSHKLGHKNTI